MARVHSTTIPAQTRDPAPSTWTDSLACPALQGPCLYFLGDCGPRSQVLKHLPAVAVLPRSRGSSVSLYWYRHSWSGLGKELRPTGSVGHLADGAPLPAEGAICAPTSALIPVPQPLGLPLFPCHSDLPGSLHLLFLLARMLFLPHSHVPPSLPSGLCSGFISSKGPSLTTMIISDIASWPLTSFV